MKRLSYLLATRNRAAYLGPVLDNADHLVPAHDLGRVRRVAGDEGHGLAHVEGDLEGAGHGEDRGVVTRLIGGAGEARGEGCGRQRGGDDQ